MLTSAAKAQTLAGAILFPPQTESFPRISAYLDVHDEQGNFIHAIRASQVRVIENGRALPVDEWRQLRPGLQVVFALNPGPAMAVRDSQGVSRYQLIQNALLNWAKSRRGSTLDDLSLLIKGGPARSHSNDPAELAAILESYNANINSSKPDLDILLNAIDLAADATPRPGMERAVVLITAPLEGDITFGLQELLSRAIQQRVRLFVCLVGAPQAFESQNAALLSNLASQTGGHFYTFSGVEGFPDLEEHFEHLRSIYFLAYTSSLTTGGTQELAVEIQQGEQRLRSPTVTFNLDLHPPEPAFISPPAEILRTVAPEKRRRFWETAQASELYPTRQDLQVLIDFPDGRQRPILRTALYVDGRLTDENIQPPFDRFVWDLSPYTETQQHLLQVEVVDSLGLTGKSIQLPVQVTVELPSVSPFVRILLKQSAVTLLIIGVLVGAGVVLILILSGRIRPRLPLTNLGVLKRAERSTSPEAQKKAISRDRATGEADIRRLPQWVNRFHWPQRRLHPKPVAYLVRLVQGEQTATSTPVPLIGEELTLGSDPTLATLLIKDASVDALHARLRRAGDGSFWIFDEGSVAGTWVNFTLVSNEGRRLEHGDLIHSGHASFRFIQPDSQPLHRPRVTLEEQGP